jgi:NADH-quinone oxidoreductase subunit L
LPLGILLVLSTAVGAFIHQPLEGVLPQLTLTADEDAKHWVEMLAIGTGFAGLALSALLFLGERRFATAVANSAPGKLL